MAARRGSALAFPNPAAAGDWPRDHPRRCAREHGAVDVPTFVGEHLHGDDVRWLLAHRSKGRVLLMERLEGVEVGLGGQSR